MEWIVIGIIGLLVVVVYAWYVRIIGNRNKAQEALSGIDVHLKQRSNLIPNILTIAQKFMDHERALMEEITALRSRVDTDYDAADVDQVRQHLAAAGQLGASLGRLMIAVEDYPDLKSDQTMLQAQRTYNEVEAQITAARRFYNASVTALNNSVQIFPGTLIGNMAGVAAFPFYEADEAARAPVSAAEYLK